MSHPNTKAMKHIMISVRDSVSSDVTKPATSTTITPPGPSSLSGWYHQHPTHSFSMATLLSSCVRNNVQANAVIVEATAWPQDNMAQYNTHAPPLFLLLKLVAVVCIQDITMRHQEMMVGTVMGIGFHDYLKIPRSCISWRNCEFLCPSKCPSIRELSWASQQACWLAERMLVSPVAT
ncbi:hypothetical protein E2C01_062903 [Portunus trituberculatus]|uniref:Uncharacterized protein n=1 Tax=Portunus trituberculatus TaxID=210409 RepID=A0A5B7HG57_PORTR|nr:hypothetical protein [Portunus trituberculatus]